MNDQNYLGNIVELVAERSSPGFAKSWHDSIQRGIERGTSPQPFGCLTVDNGELKLATSRVPADSTRGSSRT